MPNSEGNRVIASLPGFLGSYRKHFDVCLLCKAGFNTTNDKIISTAKIKLLEKFYIRCLNPHAHIEARDLVDVYGYGDEARPARGQEQDHLELKLKVAMSRSSPTPTSSPTKIQKVKEDSEIAFCFCWDCLTKLETLLEMYQKLAELERKFNNARTEMVDPAIKAYLFKLANQNQGQGQGTLFKKKEAGVMKYWRESIGLPLDLELETMRKLQDCKPKPGGDECDAKPEPDLDLDPCDTKNDNVDVDVDPDPDLTDEIATLQNASADVESEYESLFEPFEATGEFDLSLVKIEEEGNENEVSFNDDPEEFIIPDALKVKVKDDDGSLNPVVRLEKLDLLQYKKIKSEIPQSDNDNDFETCLIPESSCLNDDVAVAPCSSGVETENEDELANDEANKAEDDDIDYQPELEEDYDPPSQLKSARIHHKVVTRRRARQDISIDDDEDNSGDIPVVRSKKKYTKKRKGSKQKGEPEAKRPKRPYERRVPGMPPKKRIRKPDERVQCNVCEKFVYRSYLNFHLRVHTGEKPCVCPFCPKSFYKSSNLTSHIRTHTKVKPYACDQCEMSFSEKHGLADHKARLHGIFDRDIRKMECGICKDKFLRRNELKTHMKLIHDSDEMLDNPATVKVSDSEVPVTCDICNLTFPNRHEKYKHNRDTHVLTTREDYMCEICGKTFKGGKMNRGNFKRHMKLVHGPEQSLRFQCSYCGKGFKHKLSLDCHTVEHTGEARLKCQYCDEGFNRPPDLRKHNFEAHPTEYLKEKSFVCKDVCYMNFTTQDELTRHMESHKTSKCPFCGKIFKSQQHCRKHILTHTGEKPYTCSICERTFTQETNLKEHVYRHTGERPFRCEECDLGFLRNIEFRKHMKIVHDQEVGRNGIIKFNKHKSKQKPQTSTGESSSSSSSQINIPSSQIETQVITGPEVPENIRNFSFSTVDSSVFMSL